MVPKILMALYQKDLLDEEVVTQWGTHVSKKYVDKDISKKVRKASEPFLKVLPNLFPFNFIVLFLIIIFSGSRRLTMMTTTTTSE
jgi:eIF4-gamma/eIF5/eIF2-epsilon